MGAEQLESSDNLLFLTGLYTRVARQLGVHPSYVSRVARGERRSDRVYRAIAAELSKLRGPVLAEAQDDSDIKASKIAAAREVRRKLAQTLKSDPRLRRLSLVVVEEDERPGIRTFPKNISAASLSAKVAANARMIAGAVAAYERFSSRLERFPHMISLLDAEAIVLYSCGTTGMARKEHGNVGRDWSKDSRGLSAAARSIAAGVPVAVIGAIDLQGTFAPSVRMACPVRLSDGSVAGAVVLTIEVTRARVDHLIELTKIGKRLCKFVENGPMNTARKRDTRSRVQPYADAAKNVAMVLCLPQIDAPTRVALSGILGELEAQGQAVLHNENQHRRTKQPNAQARGAV
jgi:hypothetical protein